MTGGTGAVRRASTAVALLVALLVAACTGDDDAAPEPDPRPPTTTTTRVDLSGVDLARVPGETTTTALEGGRATIVGFVRGPTGPVPGATVRVERLGAGGATTDLLTDPEGRYEHRGVPGGRYRLRAFLPPTLAQVEPEVRFLADAQEHSIDLDVVDRTGPVVTASAAPNPPQLDQPVNLVVQVGTRRVDGDGIVRTEPVPGLRVELLGLGRWQLLAPPEATTTTSTTTSTTTRPGLPPTTTTTVATTTTTVPPSDAATTDGSGRVRFALVCRAPGSPELSVRFAVRVATPPPGEPGPDPGEGGDQETTTTEASPLTRTEVVRLDLPACIDPASTTTVPPEPGDGNGATGDDTDDTDDTGADD